MGQAPLLSHIQLLLSSQLWEAAALHVRRAAQDAASRSEARTLLTLCQDVAPSVYREGTWPHARLWLAYRLADAALLDDALAAAPQLYPAFEAFRASLRHDWSAVLTWAAQAREAPEGRGSGALDKVVAARYNALALAELGAPQWAEAYRQAAQLAQGRDRGLIHLDCAFECFRHGHDLSARDNYAQASLLLKEDAWGLSLTQVNLGITCLRLGDLHAAERALKAAVQTSQQPEGRPQLSGAWRGLGGLYFRWGQWPRAEYAYLQARLQAETRSDEVDAACAVAKVWRTQRRFDEALTLLYELAQRPDLLDTERQQLYLELACVSLRLGDVPSAKRWAGAVEPRGASATWRLKVIEAELGRQAGQSGAPLQGEQPLTDWQRREAHTFPELFALLSIEETPLPFTARLSADGPLRLWLSGAPVALEPQRLSASLLALLVLHRGHLTDGRVMDAIAFKGSDVRARKKSLSKVLGELRAVLGWPQSVSHKGGLIALSDQVVWLPLEVPAPQRADHFCEGLYDEWVLEWRREQMLAEPYAAGFGS